MSAKSTRSRRGRGGQGGHEPRARIKTRELHAWELSIKGMSQHAIARELGISQAAVSKLMKRVEERHYRELSTIVERQKAKQNARLEHLYAESQRAWEQSKVDMLRKRQRNSRSDKAGTGTTVELTTENQHGDPRYLEECRKALGDLRKLWGLDAPQKVDVRSLRNPYADLDEAQLRELVNKQSRLLEAGERPKVIDVTPEPNDRNGDA